MVVILFLMFIILLGIGLPVVFAMGISSLIYSLCFYPSSHIEIIIAHRISFGLYSWPLLAIPFFITAGLIMNRGGITKRIFTLVNDVVGHITGGLGHVNVVASLIFAGMSGSATADCGGLGQIEMEAMNKAGYDPEFSAAISASSGCIGPIFPPSISLILYGIIAEAKKTNHMFNAISSSWLHTIGRLKKYRPIIDRKPMQIINNKKN